jgi:hypothetical protein
MLLPLTAATAAQAATLQPIGNFAQPIYVTSDPGNPDRLFVVERGGRIELIQGGGVSTFADLSSVVGECCEGERGLLSMALAPDFDATGRFYVDYSPNGEPGEIHVDELTASGDSAGISTRRPLLSIPHPGAVDHNGGQLQFGPDGDLYISTGDGGGPNDKFHNAQNLSSLLGKILRIDPRQSGAQPYTVPAGNPFPAAAPPANTIWSYGLRNPFRFSFDRLSGDMVIGDVGQDEREEVDWAPSLARGVVGGAGADYGWNCLEGSIAGPATDLECATPPTEGFTDPVFDYPHEDPSGGAAHGCAIIGGYVARDPSLGGLYGRYLYGDLCVGEIRSLDLKEPLVSDRSEGIHVDNLNSFGEDSCGRLYAVSGGGAVDRLVGAAPAACGPPSSPAAQRRRSFIGLHAGRRAIKRHRKATITAWVSPCQGRKGQPVRLFRGRAHIATKRLSRACTAYFHPRIARRSTFHATIAEDATDLGATSRNLKIKVARRRR